MPRREVADHARERVRPGRGAEEVGRVVDAGDPVAQRLVDGVLEGGAAGVDRDDLGAEQLHPGDVERLPLGVDLAHVDGAVEAEVRRGGGGGDAVLAGAGLGDHPRLAHPLGQQRLAEHVADLVGAGVVEVLALEQDPGADLLGEPLGLVERARHAGVLAEDASSNSAGNAGSAIASCQATVSSSRAATSASGMKRPPNSPEPAAARRRRSASRGSGAGRSTRGHRADGGPRGRRRGPAPRRRAPRRRPRRRSAPRRRDPRCRTRRPAPGRRDQRRQPAERVRVDLERLEVAGVDADQLGAERRPRARSRPRRAPRPARSARARGPGRAAGAGRRRRARRRSAAPGRRRPPGPRGAGSRRR